MGNILAELTVAFAPAKTSAVNWRTLAPDGSASISVAHEDGSMRDTCLMMSVEYKHMGLRQMWMFEAYA